MNRSQEFSADIPAECAATLARIQRALDGDASESLAPNTHSESCRSCRERLAAARFLVAGLTGVGSVTVPSWLSGAIVAGVDADRRTRSRRRVFAAIGSLAAAAAIVVAVWVMNSGDQPEVVEQVPAPIPAPRPPEPGPGEPVPPPAPQPIRVSDQLAKASDVFRESSRALAEPLESAPKVLSGLGDALFKPATLTVSADLEPARESLSDIPDAARTGLEPVTSSAQKAFDRLFRDVSGMQPRKPKS